MTIDYKKLVQEDKDFAEYTISFMKGLLTLPQFSDMLQMLYVNYSIGISAKQTLEQVSRSQK